MKWMEKWQQAFGQYKIANIMKARRSSIPVFIMMTVFESLQAPFDSFSTKP